MTALSKTEPDASISFDEALDRLTDQQRLFVLEFVKDYHIGAAAQRAGYSPRTCHSQGSMLVKLPEIDLAIRLHQKELRQQARHQVEDILREISILATSDATVLEVDEDGKPVKKPGEEHLWKAVSSIKRRTITTRDGKTVREVEVKLWSKTEALKLLGQHLGAWTGDAAVVRDQVPTVVFVGTDLDALASMGEASPRLVEASEPPAGE